MIDDGNTRDELAPEESMGIDGMSEVQDDETLRDVVAALSALPPVSEADVQRIVGRVAAEAAATGRRSAQRWSTARPSHETRQPGVVPMRPTRPRWFSAIPLAAAAGFALAAGVGGFLLRGVAARPEAPAASMVAASGPAESTAGMTLTPVAAATNAEAPIETQFVLDAPAAGRVALVGAFNGWDASATPLVRDARTGLWSVTLPLAPGRHVYAFMVDDSLTLDPRAPSTQDRELGTNGSVVLVGAP